jgi:ribosomal protein S18 acetylase RimI-like enzyme
MLITVRDHIPTELRTLIAVAGRAFWDDPLFNFFQPDLLKQQRHLAGYFAAALKDCARHGTLQTASVDHAEHVPAGLAAWLPPGSTEPVTASRIANQARYAAPVIVRTTAPVKALRLFNEMQRHRPPTDSWHLVVLATDPRFQGKGVGTSLMRPVLERCDEQGHAADLETQKESNLAYYRRFGFEVSHIIDKYKAPKIWLMHRDPR